jgi:DNA-binding Lrp family transcriptional regulator
VEMNSNRKKRKTVSAKAVSLQQATKVPPMK